MDTCVPQSPRRWTATPGNGRMILRWVLTVVLTLLAVLDVGEDESAPDLTIEVTEGTPAALEILTIKPRSPAVGGSAQIGFTAPVLGALDAIRVQVGGIPAELIDVGVGGVAFRVPAEIPEGQVLVEVFLPSGERLSRRVQVRALRRGRTLRNLAGGLVFLIWGPQVLSAGVRKLAGKRVRATVARWTQHPLRGLGLGAVLGALAQSMTSAAALIVGLLESKVIRSVPAVRLLVGAQLGAAFVVLLLPFGVSRDALWLVCVGVVWVMLAHDRRAVAVGKIILGLGLLLFGMALLRIAFQPLVEDPALLPYATSLRQSGAQGLLVRIALGVMLGGVLQGPGMALAIVVGLGESSGVFNVRHALDVMIGVNAGASLATIALTWPFGRSATRLALAHVMVGVTTSIVFALAAWPSAIVADGLVVGDPEQIIYGKKIMFPHLSGHVVVAFALAQTIAVATTVWFVPKLVQATKRLLPSPSSSRVRQPPADSLAITTMIQTDLERCKDVLESSFALLVTGERRPAESLARELERVRRDIVDVAANVPEELRRDMPYEFGAVSIALVHMQRSLEHLHHLAETTCERSIDLPASGIDAVGALHAMVLDSLATVLDHLGGWSALDFDRLQSKEIAINAREAELARLMVTSIAREGTDSSTALLIAEVLGTYEEIGNQIYRMGEALMGGWDDLA